MSIHKKLRIHISQCFFQNNGHDVEIQSGMGKLEIGHGACGNNEEGVHAGSPDVGKNMGGGITLPLSMSFSGDADVRVRNMVHGMISDGMISDGNEQLQTCEGNANN